MLGVSIVLFVVLLAVLFAVAAVTAGFGDLMKPVFQDARPVGLPEEHVAPDDLDALRFNVVLRGYKMAEVDAVLHRMSRELAERDAVLAELRGDRVPRSFRPEPPPVPPVPPPYESPVFAGQSYERQSYEGQSYEGQPTELLAGQSYEDRPVEGLPYADHPTELIAAYVDPDVITDDSPSVPGAEQPTSTDAEQPTASDAEQPAVDAADPEAHRSVDADAPTEEFRPVVDQPPTTD